MARKERNSIDYFPHPVNHGRKMYYLRNKFKNNGYTVWFMLLEHLGKAEYHYLDLKEETQLMYLSSEFMITEELLIEIINALVKLGEFDKNLWQNESILFNEKYINSISDAYKKRNNECINKNSLLLLLESKGRLNKLKSIPKLIKNNIKGSEKPQRKEKNTILKKIKVNKNVVEIITYLNEKANRKYSLKSKANNAIINTRLNEGYTIEDMKKIIDNKCKSWLNTDMDKYLRPETLFCVKHFESYLNEPVQKTDDEIIAELIKKKEDENKGN